MNLTAKYEPYLHYGDIKVGDMVKVIGLHVQKEILLPSEIDTFVIGNIFVVTEVNQCTYGQDNCFVGAGKCRINGYAIRGTLADQTGWPGMYLCPCRISDLNGLEYKWRAQNEPQPQI